MSLFGDSDNPPYGYLLGEYFHLVSTIGAMESEIDEANLEQNETYQRLIEGRQEIRERLADASQSYAESDIEVALDEAFSNS